MAHLPLVPLTYLALLDMIEYILLEASLREPLLDSPVSLRESLMARQWSVMGGTRYLLLELRTPSQEDPVPEVNNLIHHPVPIIYWVTTARL